MREFESVTAVDERVSLGRSTLQMAALKNDIEEIKFLLSKGAKINLKDNWGQTPLHWAADENEDSSHHEVMKLLLQNGADITARDNDDRQPLHHLMKEGIPAVETVQMFLDLGADVKGKDNDGYTPLFRAISEEQDLDVVKLLVNYGADMSVRRNSDYTLLHEASWHNNSVTLEIIKYLLKNGADINALDKNGYTPIIHSTGQVSRDNNKVFRFFLKYSNVNIVDSQGKHILNYCNINKLAWKCIMEHFAKLQALDISVNPAILEKINSKKKYKAYFEECKKELSMAKGIKFRDSWVSYFNLLFDNKRKLKNYAGNEVLIQEFENSEPLKKFPIYGDEMEENTKKGIKRRKLFDESAVVLSTDCLPILNPTHLIVRDVLDCLSTKDLCKFSNKQLR